MDKSNLHIYTGGMSSLVNPRHFSSHQTEWKPLDLPHLWWQVQSATTVVPISLVTGRRLTRRVRNLMPRRNQNPTLVQDRFITAAIGRKTVHALTIQSYGSKKTQENAATPQEIHHEIRKQTIVVKIQAMNNPPPRRSDDTNAHTCCSRNLAVLDNENTQLAPRSSFAFPQR